MNPLKLLLLPLAFLDYRKKKLLLNQQDSLAILKGAIPLKERIPTMNELQEAHDLLDSLNTKKGTLKERILSLLDHSKKKTSSSSSSLEENSPQTIPLGNNLSAKLSFSFSQDEEDNQD